MSDDKPTLPPLRLRPEDDTDSEEANIRRRAIERQTGQSAPSNQRSRPVYPSDIARRQRTITITLPEDDMMDYLKEAAEQVSEDAGTEVSTTKLATLILVAGLEQWREGRLALSTESTEIEKLTVKPAAEVD